MELAKILGFIAGTLTTSSLIPQLRKLWKTKSAKDLSIGMYVVMTSGVALWLTYGIMQGDPVIIITNAVSLVLAVTNLVMMIKYK